MNSFQSISGDSENSSVTPRGVSRRSVMKAGAAAAWSVPLVQVVAAAPAVAVSGPTTLVASPGAAGWNGNSANIAAPVTVRNTGSNDSLALQVTYTFKSGWTGGSATAPTGWTVSPPTGMVFTFTADSQVAGGTEVSLAATFRSQNGKGFAATIDVSATATNAEPAPTVVQVPAKP